MGFSEDRAKGRYGDCYLLVAENPYVLWEATEHWKQTWQEQSAREPAGPMTCTTHVLYGNDLLLDRLAALVGSLPMFAERQLVIIKDIDRIPAKSGEAIGPILQARTDAVKLLLTAASVDRRRKWVKDLTASMPVESFRRIYDNELPGWVRHIAGDLGWSIAPPVADRLAMVHGFDLFEIRQTLERAILHIGQKRRIEQADIDTILAGEGEHNIYGLLDRIAARDLDSAVTVLHALYAAGVTPIPWLAAMFTHYQRLLQCCRLPRNIRDMQAAKELGVQPFIAGKMMQESRAFGRAGLEFAMRLTFETERLLRFSILPPRLAFDLLVYRLCARQRGGHSSLFRGLTGE